MAHIEVSIQLNATPEHVWSIVEPVENHVDWMADAVAIRFLNEQTRGVGTEFFCDTKVGPIKLVDKMEITEWIPQQVMGVRHVGVVTGTGKFTLTPHLGGTTFTWAEELKFPHLSLRLPVPLEQPGAALIARLPFQPAWLPASV